jgi:phosphohistidine swiveling domain-containing protein/HEPN domain-containing protein
MLKKEEYLKTVRRPYPVLFCTLVCRGYRDKEVFEGVLKEPFQYLHMAHVDDVWYYSKKEVEIGGNLALLTWMDPGRLEATKIEFDKREAAFVDSALKDFASFAQGYHNYMVTLNLVFAVEKPAEIALRAALREKISEVEADELMSQLNIPIQDNIYKKEEYELVTTDNIEEHVKKYIWLKARYGEDVQYTKKDARERLKSINKDQFLKDWNEAKEKLAQHIDHAKKILGGKAILVDIFQFIIYYRTHRTDTMNRAQYLAVPMLKTKSNTLGLSYVQFLECNAEEVLTNQIPDVSILNERIKDCSVLMDEGRIYCFHGLESEKLKEFFKEEVGLTQELKGTIACKGKVKGKVIIIKNSADFEKVQEGDVLVTSMTTPEMVPIMKKASAFVTDEGGVTCHAAIVAREMRKPCIIGTKNATKVFKDGDIVEVDAEKGIVRIIK